MGCAAHGRARWGRRAEEAACRTSDQFVRSLKLSSVLSSSFNHSPKTSSMKCAVDSTPPSSSSTASFFPLPFFGAAAVASSPRRMGPSALSFIGLSVDVTTMAGPDGGPRTPSSPLI